MADLSPPAIHVHDPTRGRFGNQERLGYCREALLDLVGIDHIAFQTSGSQDFTVDALPESDQPGRTERERQHLSELGNQLRARFVEVDNAVRRWQTGVLIRLVLHGARRLVVCNAVTHEQLIIASGPLERGTSPEDTLEADARVAALTDKLRELVRLPSQDPGGFHTQRTASADVVGGSTDAEPFLEVTGVPGRIAETLAAAVDPADLHYAAYVRAGVWHCSADVLDHPRLALYSSRSATSEIRRLYYHDFGTSLCTGPESLLGQLTLQAEDTIGEIGRFVIDVELGGFYAYRLGDDDFLLAVTLDQSQVRNVDLRVMNVANKLAG